MPGDISRSHLGHVDEDLVFVVTRTAFIVHIILLMG